MKGGLFFFFAAVNIFCSNVCASEAVKNESTPSREIHVSMVSELVDTEEGRQSLTTEFESIKGGQRKPWTVASLPENIKKNRYDDLLAYDDTRVVLNKLPNDPYSDYINANYIDAWNGNEKEYVATQGPLPDTINDFWRMIWQLNASKIVMLASVFEHGSMKVAPYWPAKIAVYGDITVTQIAEHSIPRLQHVIRTFYLQKVGVTVPRIVRQFHFTGWPDFGVPADRLQVVSLMRQARLYRPDHKAPIVVHCSAGIGRTGTIILMDSMIQRAKVEKLVDFPKRLDSMRLQRPDLVEKKGQYIFAYETVNDVFNNPETDTYLKKAEEEYMELDKIMDNNNYRPPKNMEFGLERLKWHGHLMALLIDNLLQQKLSSKAAIIGSA